MSALQILQNVSTIGIGSTTNFGANGGTPPYTFAITNAGAGGYINPLTGYYTAPYQIVSTPTNSVDVITVTDHVSATANTSINVGGVLELVCDILANGMNLPNGRVVVWDQKWNMPTDSNLWITVSMMNCKPFGNDSSFQVIPTAPLNNLFAYRNYTQSAPVNTSPFNTYGAFSTTANWLSYQQTTNGVYSNVQSVNMQGILDIDIISRGPTARDQKELIPLALQSTYSEQQQEANSFFIAKLPWGGQFVNLSNIDGSAIPYRYKISYAIQYFIRNVVPVPYFTQFSASKLTVNS